MKIKEYLGLMGVKCKVALKNNLEFVKVAYKYYGNAQFCKADLLLYFKYFLSGPFNLHKIFLMEKGEKDLYTYGETPLTTLEKIAIEAKIKPADTVVELGSGRGHNCFWLSSIIGCRAIGIEYVPDFIKRANWVKEKLLLKQVEFLCQDFLNLDEPLPIGNVYYLYGSCFDDKEIKILAAKFLKIKTPVKIITVSYPLTDYADTKAFEVLKHFKAPFTWGMADVYIQVTNKGVS